MISNSGEQAAVRSNKNLELALYDELPPVIRKAFQDAARNYEVIPTARALIAGASPARVLAVLLGEDAHVRAHADARIAQGEPVC